MVALKVVGDSEIVVQQVRNAIHYFSPCLKSYQPQVWWLISKFQAFNIIVVPRTCIAAGNSLANTAASMSLLRDRCIVEFFYKPFVSNNITELRIFFYGQHILHSMKNVDAFKDTTTDEDEHEQPLQTTTNGKKGNPIPKGVFLSVISLNCRDAIKGKNSRTHRSSTMNEQRNLRANHDLKIVSLGV